MIQISNNTKCIEVVKNSPAKTESRTWLKTWYFIEINGNRLDILNIASLVFKVGINIAENISVISSGDTTVMLWTLEVLILVTRGTIPKFTELFWTWSYGSCSERFFLIYSSVRIYWNYKR